MQLHCRSIAAEAQQSTTRTLVYAGKKIREGGERIEHQANEFSHRTATGATEIGAGDNEGKVN
jgi:hypothetical protein